MERLKDKPFALIGVNSDRDREKIKQVCKDENISWRSFWNGGSTQGPISTAWNVRGWPTIYVLDENGVIRFKNTRDEAMDKAVDELLAKLEQGEGEAGAGRTGAGKAGAGDASSGKTGTGRKGE